MKQRQVSCYCGHSKDAHSPGGCYGCVEDPWDNLYDDYQHDYQEVAW